MSAMPEETLVRAVFAPARSLEPTEIEIVGVLARAGAAAGARLGPRRPRSWRRLAPAGVAALALLVGGGYAAAPPLRAAIDDVAGTFSGWLGGDASVAPGRPLLSGDQAPDYFRDARYSIDPRVIAEADGYKLYAAREPGGTLEFDLGDTGFGEGGISADDFRDHALIVLGPGAVQNADEHGHVPLFGITARAVKTVELTYEVGPPLRLDDVNGGFVLLAEPRRRPHEVIALDGDGRELEHTLVDDSSHPGPQIDWSQYGPPSPRVPAECLPGAVGPTPPPTCPGG